MAIVFQAMTLGVAWVMRDGHRMFRCCAAAAVTYWAVAIWTVWTLRRRGRRPSHGDLMFLTVGYFLLALGAVVIQNIAQRLGWG